jgi:hypothetical protein
MSSHIAIFAEPRDRLRVGSDEIAIRVTSEDSGGMLLAADVSLLSGGGPPMMHRHAPDEV